MGCLKNQENKCYFCDEIETVDHVILFCNFSWYIWCKCGNWLNIAWAIPSSLKLPFQYWCSLNIKKNQTLIWGTLFYAILWSIWLTRNKKIFNDKSISLDHVCNFICTRLGWWLKAKYPDLNFPILHFMTNIQELSISIT